MLESDHRTSDRLVTRLLYRWAVRPALLCPSCQTRGKWRSSYQCLRSSLTEMETKWRVGPQYSWGAAGPPSTHPVLQTAFPRIWWWDRPLKRSRAMLIWHNLTRENWKESNNFLLQVLDICTNMKKRNLTAQLNFRLMWSRCYFSYFLLLPPHPLGPRVSGWEALQLTRFILHIWPNFCFAAISSLHNNKNCLLNLFK